MWRPRRIRASLPAGPRCRLTVLRRPVHLLHQIGHRDRRALGELDDGDLQSLAAAEVVTARRRDGANRFFRQFEARTATTAAIFPKRGDLDVLGLIRHGLECRSKTRELALITQELVQPHRFAHRSPLP